MSEVTSQVLVGRKKMERVSSRRVLVVAGDRTLGARVSDLLKHTGYEVAGPVRNILEAKRAVGIEGIDGAVIDADLKRENSLTLAGEIARQGAAVLLLSDAAQPAAKGNRGQAYPHLAKDFSRNEFRRRIAALFARRSHSN
jgi:DNA-binding response OmpR family regulator